MCRCEASLGRRLRRQHRRLRFTGALGRLVERLDLSAGHPWCLLPPRDQR